MKDVRKLFAAAFLLAVSLLFSTAAEAQKQHVFYVAPNGGNLWELTYPSSSGSWTTTNIFNGQVFSPQNDTIASFAGGGKMYLCYFNSTNGQPPFESVYVMSTTNNLGWTTAAVSTLEVDINSGLTGLVDAGGVPRIFSVETPVGGTEYILETFWNGSTWQTVTLYGGVQPGTPVVAYLFNGNPHVYWIAVDGSIQQGVLVGSNWSFTNVTLASGAPFPKSGSALLAYQFNSNATLYFIANDNHVHESFWSGSSWGTSDVTARAGAPNSQPGTPLMGYMYNGMPHINYIAVDGHIHQMWWTGSQWGTNDWTFLSGSVPPLFPSPLTGYAINGQATVFYAILSGQYILIENWWNGSKTQSTGFSLEGQGGSSANGLASAIL